ncbi:MAG: hypothetical protein GTN80_04495, partial [Nitrososphaeria archaeon]|nr:hypothetical protein [Nitrososphaeria archaeon]NIT03953.1 hypothetical protein [Candidatus Saccharibacteria bacterium]
EINEDGLFGYEFVSIENQIEGVGCPETLGETVTLSEGQDLVCIITNDDIAPSLVVVKIVINDGIGAAN